MYPTREYKGDSNAEWHPIENTVTGEGEVFCQVCGEPHDRSRFAGGTTVTCDDCGIFMEEIAVPSIGVYIVLYETTENAGAADKFYTRLDTAWQKRVNG